jgi:hypothetical protein
VRFANFTISFLLRFNHIIYSFSFDCFDGNREVFLEDNLKVRFSNFTISFFLLIFNHVKYEL